MAEYSSTEQVTKFPMTIRFNEEPTTEIIPSNKTIDVTMLDHPHGDFRERCFDMIMSTWQDNVGEFQEPKTEREIHKTFMKLLSGKVLPNSLEHLTFMFRISGITLVEITHILRHRLFFSIHAQCTADRFLTHDSSMIPTSIIGTEFEDEYIELTRKTKVLYQKMCDSKRISVMDARYILPRNQRYFYYVGMNLKDAISFIKQRRCTAIQPELDNEIARQIYNHISTIIPEIKEVLSLNCDHSCHTTFGNEEHTTRLYKPDETHERLISEKKKQSINPDNYIYSSTREEMGSFYSQPGESNKL